MVRDNNEIQRGDTIESGNVETSDDGRLEMTPGVTGDQHVTKPGQISRINRVSHIDNTDARYFKHLQTNIKFLSGENLGQTGHNLRRTVNGFMKRLRRICKTTALNGNGK